MRARIAKILTFVALSGLLAACASGGAGGGLAGGDPNVVGDEKGGRITGGVGEGGTTAASMRAVTAHCAKFGKKAFVTQMESPAQGGLIAFVCLDR
ncbi:MAG: hypothetical protein ACXWKC_17120 [Xanthobacteraceae bacterium]